MSPINVTIKYLPSPLLTFTSIKLGVIEDHSNRTRLAKLLRFFSSNSETEQTSLADYVERMKDKQENIYFMAGSSREEVVKSPFVERLLKKGYEVIFLIEPVDEYCIQVSFCPVFRKMSMPKRDSYSWRKWPMQW